MLINVLKALISIIPMCSLHVILLSQIIPRYFSRLTKGIFRPFNIKVSCRWPKSMRKVDGLSLVLIDFYVLALMPCLNTSETLLQLSENNLLCGLLHIYRCHQQRDLDTRCLGHTILYAVQCGGEDKTLWHPCLYTPWCRNFTFNQNWIFSEKEKI
jgi:hypothetical protein